MLFAGGGGSSDGYSLATGEPVWAAINHDAAAIQMHRTNHPYTRHYQEDIFAADPREVMQGHPCGFLWASPDCTHFSKARGGVPKSKAIRGLSWVIVKWALYVAPEVMMMENVEEIRTWGPLIETESGLQPDPVRKGETFDGFIKIMTTGLPMDHPALLECCEFLHVEPFSPEAHRLSAGLGYDFDSRNLCAADFGVPTIRTRFFGVFRRDGQPIVWPKPTHSKDGTGGQKKWRAAAEIIDWTLPCPSIFASKAQVKKQYGLNAVRPLRPNTLKRIIRGVDKFTIRSATPFLLQVKFDNQAQDIDLPLTTVTAVGAHELCRPYIAPFTATNSSNAVGTDMREPVNTARTGGGGGQLMASVSLMSIGQTNGGDRVRSVTEPINTTVSKAETCITAAHLTQYHGLKGSETRGQSADEPIRTIDAAGRYGLATAQLTEYYGNGQPISVEDPMHTVVSKDREALAVAHVAEFRSQDIGAGADKPLRTVASHDHSSLCLSHVTKFKGTNLGQSAHDPLQTITTESGGGSYGVVYATVKYYGPDMDLGHWPEIRALLNRYCGYELADDEVILLHICGAWYYISDIGLRMLTPRELYDAMGFPHDHIIDHDYTGAVYTKAEQVDKCGNAVCPPMAAALIRVNLPDWCRKPARDLADVNRRAAV